MANLRLTQPTNMGLISNNVATSSAFYTPTELNLFGPANEVFLTLIGTFETGPANPPDGPVTEVFIDDADSGVFPNLQFTELSYDLTEATYDTLLNDGAIFDFVADLLSGSDTITGSGQADTLLGFNGNDVLIGGAGGDVLSGGAGNNTASYRTAAAGVFAGIEDAEFNTGEALGDSYIDISHLEGSAFRDFLYGNGAVNRLSGGAGNDVLAGKGGGDTFVGGSGTDTVSYDASLAVRADLLNPSTNAGDAVGDTYSSIEYLEGSAFDDTLLGDNLANVLRGSSYPDDVSGNDRLYGRGGNDVLDGYDGNDQLDGGSGADKMRGGAGNDRFYVDNAGDIVTESANQGTADRVLASVDYVLIGLNVEILSTSSTSSTSAIDLTGNAQLNTIYGNAGNNILDGRGGSDTLKGYGGADTFLFRDALGASNVDRISDFNVAQDTIRLENAIFNAIVGTGTLTAAQFVANATGVAADSSDRIVYETDTGELFYDSNGSAVGGSVQFATLSAGLALTNLDFFVI